MSTTDASSALKVHRGSRRSRSARSRDKRFKYVSLFSGAMGLDIGLHITREFELLAAVELDSNFCATIVANRDLGRVIDSSALVYEGSIEDLEPEALMQDLDLAPGELDLLVGGPPCQAFSTSGRRGSLQDPRGTLLWQFLKFVEVLQPRYFLMENVRGLMSASIVHRPIAERPERGGPPLRPEEEPGSVVDAFMADLSGAYRMDIFEVNAVNYGAPQIRERVLFIGNREGKVVDFPMPTHGIATATPTLFESETLKPYVTLREALDGLQEDEPVILDFSPRKKSYLELIPPGSNWRALPPEVAEESMGRAYLAKGGRSGWWRRLTFDLPSPTIVTMPNHASTALCHPTETRALTLRECARVQEFPDDWVFIGSPSAQYAQVGNAVPVRLGRVAGELLAEMLRQPTERVSVSIPRVRQVYLQSHVRTRKWFKNGQAIQWNDGGENDHADYGAAKTLRKEHQRAV